MLHSRLRLSLAHRLCLLDCDPLHLFSSVEDTEREKKVRVKIWKTLPIFQGCAQYYMSFLVHQYFLAR